jgi:peptidoglycan/xylan/chitin deacetylase (PgdA/CDA1 family)
MSNGRLPAQDRWTYAPIIPRPGERWPNGARLAVYVALGVEEYVFGAGRTEDILPGATQPDLVNTSWRDYGNRVGGFRLLDRFGELGIRPGLMLNTAVYDHAPALMAAARAAGAEIVAHGHTNSDCLAGMTEAAEAAYLRAIAARITAEEGAPPQGWSSPWLAHTPATIDLLTEAGFGYLMDFRLDDRPVWLRARQGRLLALPYGLEINDSSTIIGRMASAREFAEMIIDEFDEMLAQAEQGPLVMSIVVHSFISGQPFRLRALTRALDHIAAHRSDIWLARPGEIAAHVAARPECAA